MTDLRWRIVVHALDRTGPPMLAASLLRWARREHPGDTVDVVAFRGGELIDEFVRWAPTTVVLDPSEEWDARAPKASRLRVVQERCAVLPAVDVTLLVSVAASQALAVLPVTPAPVVTWAVEQGDDLHWIDDRIGLRERTTRWLAGSAGTLDALRSRLGDNAEIVVCREFVDRAERRSADERARCRLALGAGPDDLLVVGAGIGTARKGVDLFLELALRTQRHPDGRHVRLAWLGGERDDLYWRVRAETERLGLQHVRWFGNVSDVTPWLDAADVFAQTARLDAFPLVCLTAAMLGTPIVAFRGTGGVEEMLGDAFVGAPYPDVSGLAELVLSVLDGPAERQRVGAAQREAVSDRFSTAAAAPAIRGELASVVVDASGAVEGARR